MTHSHRWNRRWDVLTFAVFAAVLLSLALTGCGGNSGPSAPSTVPTAQPTPTVSDGMTGSPVPGVVTTPESPAVGSPTTFEAPGYIPRTQSYSGTIYLWPGDSSDVDRLVYTSVTGERQAMRRWSSPPVIYTPVPSPALESAAETMSALTGIPWAVSLTSGTVEVAIRTSGDCWGEVHWHACTTRYMQGDTIVGALVEFRSEAGIRGEEMPQAILHELGHVAGLGHEDGGFMEQGSGPGTAPSQQERVALWMMYQHRAPGNTYPDNQP